MSTLPAWASTSSRSRRLAFGTLVKTRFFSSTGVNSAALLSLGQRFFVDVGRVNLRPIPVFGGAQRLGEQHRDAVCLLARGDARAPDPDRLVFFLPGDHPGQDLVLQVFPCRRIAEVAGDVDQDGVEKGGKLFLMKLQVLEIGFVVSDPHLRHSLGEPAVQGGALVATEIETPILQQVLEEAVEVGILRIVGHWAMPFMIRVTSADGISSSGRMKSAFPDLMAAAGMPENSAERSSWAITVPPIFLIAPMPIDPSLPVPVRTTAMARSL